MYICEIIRVYSHPIRIAYFLYFFWGTSMYSGYIRGPVYYPQL